MAIVLASVLLLLALIGCGKDSSPGPASKPVPQPTVELTVSKSGAIQSQGVPFDIGQISKWEKAEVGKHAKERILVRLPDDLPFSTVSPLLDALVQASRVNIALVEDSAREAKPVQLPISDSHGSHSFRVFTGGVAYDEDAQPWTGDRLWLRMRSHPGGAILVEGIQISKTNPTQTEIEGIPGTLGPKERPWGGKHPALGRWDPKTLREFLNEQGVAALSPVCILEVRGGDRMGDVLQCLSSVQSIAAPRVLAIYLLDR